MGRTGAGGYGGISTMNQDQRQGPFHPHKSISRHYESLKDIWWIKCLHCGLNVERTGTQYYARELNLPSECNKDQYKEENAHGN
jgi:hypothetical protein